MASIPPSEHARSMVNLDFDLFPDSTALGVLWNIETDTFHFRIVKTLKQKNEYTKSNVIICQFAVQPIGCHHAIHSSWQTGTSMFMSIELRLG